MVDFRLTGVVMLLLSNGPLVQATHGHKYLLTAETVQT